MNTQKQKLSRAETARRLGVSRTYVTLLIQSKRQPSRQLVGKMQELMLEYELPDGLTRALVEMG